jgi:hypothetical protein
MRTIFGKLAIGTTFRAVNIVSQQVQSDCPHYTKIVPGMLNGKYPINCEFWISTHTKGFGFFEDWTDVEVEEPHTILGQGDYEKRLTD